MSSTAGPPAGPVELLTELVAINSVNPLQAGERSGPGGETELATWLAERADGLGADVTVDEVIDGRANFYAVFPGSSDHRIAVDVHLDTVGVEHMTIDPFAAFVDGGRLHGRGSVDTKATLAVLFALLKESNAADRRPRPELVVVGTVGEEAGGLLGAYRFNDWAAERNLRFDQIVVAEPTSCAPVHGHKGGVGLEITVRGRAAHSSKPHLGLNAIAAAARIIEAFDAEHERMIKGPSSTAVGTGTLSITEVSGGLARNIIPDHCFVYAGRRVAPGEDPEAEFERLCELARRAAAPLDVEVAMSNGRCSHAFYEDPGSPIVVELGRLAGEGPATASYGSNALVYRDIADQIVVFGPGSIDQAHTADEWIELSELERASGIYRRWLDLG